MPWKALALLLVAWSTFAPFANASSCVTVCCSQMQACCGHCHCTPGATCAFSKAPPIDQQVLAEQVELSPRVEVELFALNFDFVPALHSERAVVSWLPESPPPDTAQVSQPRLCTWLI